MLYFLLTSFGSPVTQSNLRGQHYNQSRITLSHNETHSHPHDISVMLPEKKVIIEKLHTLAHICCVQHNIGNELIIPKRCLPLLSALLIHNSPDSGPGSVSVNGPMRKKAWYLIPEIVWNQSRQENVLLSSLKWMESEDIIALLSREYHINETISYEIVLWAALRLVQSALCIHTAVLHCQVISH